MLITVILFFVKALVVILFFFLVAAYLVWGERKFAAYTQDRVGPNKVGPKGLLQIMADAVKLFFKEDYTPPFVNRYLYSTAPIIIYTVPLIALALIPIGSLTYTSNAYNSSLDFGIFSAKSITSVISVQDIPESGILTLAVLGLMVLAHAYGGWSSNSKYPILGGLRAISQLVSYELLLVISVMSVFMSAGTFSLQEIVLDQKGTILGGLLPNWYIFRQPLAFLIFLVAAVAASKRGPFDLPEADQELVAGHHTEYSSMRWALFMFGEYLGMIFLSAFMVTVFLGGWHLPPLFDFLIPSKPGIFMGIVTFLIFFVKTLTIVALFMFFRWTYPRIRWDHLVKRAWVSLLPLGIVNLILTAFSLRIW